MSMYVVGYGKKLAIYKVFMQVFHLIVEKYVVTVYNLFLTVFYNSTYLFIVSPLAENNSCFIRNGAPVGIG